jgi:hypothetical protein
MVSPALRSKERVSENGEVFTPFDIVDKMNALIPEDVWKDKAYIFLEPTSGDGQFIVRILEKRLKSGLSIEESLNTIFGMDIMQDNIKRCFERVLDICRNKMREEGFLEGDDTWMERLTNILAILTNNIYLVKDSLVEIKEGKFDKKKFVFEDPTGHSMVLSKSDRDKLLNKVRSVMRRRESNGHKVYA